MSVDRSRATNRASAEVIPYRTTSVVLGVDSVLALESSAQKFNPFGRANSARLEWASGLNVPVARAGEAVELLYWVGCAGAFDPAGREVTRAVVATLQGRIVARGAEQARRKPTADWVAYDFVLQGRRPSEPYSGLSFEVTLGEQDFVVVGTWAEKDATLGHCCFVTADGLTDAAQKVVAAAKGAA